MNRTVAYIRVSTDKQDIENQRFEVQRFLGFEPEWVEDVVSGSKDMHERKLGALLESLKPGDTLVVSEVSRISRRMLDIMEALKFCISNGITIKTVKDGFEFKDDINSQVMAFAFGLAADIERRLISQRTKEALKRKKAEGVKLGRPAGTYHRHHYKLHEHEADIYELLHSGLNPSEAGLARKFGVNRETMRRFINDRNLRQYGRDLNARLHEMGSQ